MLLLGACSQILAHSLRAWQPPFPLYLASFFLASLGQAYQDTHANTFVASVRGAHRWLGFIHAMYMAGCLVGPFASTAVASASHPSHWTLFYTVPLGLGCVNFTLASIAFRDRVRFKKREMAPATNNPQGSRHQDALSEIRRTLLTPGVWLLSLYFFFFLGAAITAGGKSSLLVARSWLIGYRMGG